MKKFVATAVIAIAVINAMAQQNDFQIGFYILSPAYEWKNNGVPWGEAMNTAVNASGHPTSPLNVLNEDGVTTVGVYNNESWNTTRLKSFVNLCALNDEYNTGGLKLLPLSPGSFLANTYYHPILYEDVYTGSGTFTFNYGHGFTDPDVRPLDRYVGSLHQGVLGYDGSFLFSEVYGNSLYSDNIWGFRGPEEPNFLHQRWTDYTFDSEIQQTEFPPQYIDDWYSKLNTEQAQFNTSYYQALWLAQHNRSLEYGDNDAEKMIDRVPGDGNNSQNYVWNTSNNSWKIEDWDPMDYLQMFTDVSNSNVALFEGSYNVAYPGTSIPWAPESGNKNYSTISTVPHQLSKFWNIDIMKEYNPNVHAAIVASVPHGVYQFGDSWEGAGSGEIIESDPKTWGNYQHFNTTTFYRDGPNYGNANWHWFTAYNSIIHGVNGVWFYNFGWRSNEYGNRFERTKPSVPNTGQYEEDKFPFTYRKFTKYLIQELRYLKNKNLLSTDPKSIVLTKTDELDENGIVPPIHVYNTNPNYNQQEGYGLRYTIRRNGEGDCIMIISNPSPVDLTDVELDFSCINIPEISDAMSVEVLFTSGLGINGSDYKVDRNSGIDLTNNTLSSVVNKTSDFLDKKLKLNFMEYDVHVIKFTQNPVNNDWTEVWSNNGNNEVNDWDFSDFDKMYFGNFDGSADGTEEMLCVQSGLGNNYMSMYKYNPSIDNWNKLWSNYGSGFELFKDNMIVCDSDGDGKDELWCQHSSGTGWTRQFIYDPFSNSLLIGWNSNGCGLTGSPISLWRDRWIKGDFSGNGDDEILAFNNFTGTIALLNWDDNIGLCGDWSVVWSTTGSHASHLLLNHFSDDIRVADVVGDGKDELICFGNTARVFEWNSGNFNLTWSNGGSGGFDSYSYPFDVDDRFVFGDFDFTSGGSNDNREELFVSGSSPSSAYAASMDFNLISGGTSWEWNWNWPANKQAIVKYGNWRVASSSSNVTTRYYSAKLVANDPDYLIGFKVCTDNTLMSVHKANTSVQSNFKKGAATGTNDVRDTPVLIFPNPASNQLSVSAGDEIERLSIYSIDGQLIQEVNMRNKMEITLNISDFSEGVYTLKVLTHSGPHIQQFIKQ